MANPILVRQAVRKFKQEPVAKADIDKMVQAFNAAPCGLNETKVMMCTVVKEKENLKMIEDRVGEAVYNAPLIFLIATEKDNKFGQLDSAVAAENVMIAAADNGLGSVYSMSGGMALNEYSDTLEKLGIPGNFEAQVAVCIGKPVKELKELNRNGRYKIVRR